DAPGHARRRLRAMDQGFSRRVVTRMRSGVRPRQKGVCVRVFLLSTTLLCVAACASPTPPGSNVDLTPPAFAERPPPVFPPDQTASAPPPAVALAPVSSSPGAPVPLTPVPGGNSELSV